MRTVSPEATEQLAQAAARAGESLAQDPADAERSEAPASDGVTAEPGPTARPWAEPDMDADDVPEPWRRHVAELEAKAAPRVPQRRRVGRVVAAGVAGGLLLTAVAVAVVNAFDEPGQGADRTPTATGTPAVTDRAVPAPQDVTARGRPTAPSCSAGPTRTPNPATATCGAWRPRATRPRWTPSTGPRCRSTRGQPGQLCVEISIVRGDGRYSAQPAVGCAQSMTSHTGRGRRWPAPRCPRGPGGARRPCSGYPGARCPRSTSTTARSGSPTVGPTARPVEHPGRGARRRSGRGSGGLRRAAGRGRPAGRAGPDRTGRPGHGQRRGRGHDVLDRPGVDGPWCGQRAERRTAACRPSAG